MTETHLELAKAKGEILMEGYLLNVQNLENNQDFGKMVVELASRINQY